jgi:hypothetical protein
MNMQLLARIQKTRAYLDYLENHILNVKEAYRVIRSACQNMAVFQDEEQRQLLYKEVEAHDLSKLDIEEFTQYRESFYGCEEDGPICRSEFDDAWKHHYQNNNHHPDDWPSLDATPENHLDFERRLIHMVIDWTAMGYKFNDTAQAYYESDRCKFEFKEEAHTLLYLIFDNITRYEGDSN